MAKIRFTIQLESESSESGIKVLKSRIKYEEFLGAVRGWVPLELKNVPLTYLGLITKHIYTAITDQCLERVSFAEIKLDRDFPNG